MSLLKNTLSKKINFEIKPHHFKSPTYKVTGADKTNENTS